MYIIGPAFKPSPSFAGGPSVLGGPHRRSNRRWLHCLAPGGWANHGTNGTIGQRFWGKIVTIVIIVVLTNIIISLP